MKGSELVDTLRDVLLNRGAHALADELTRLGGEQFEAGREELGTLLRIAAAQVADKGPDAAANALEIIHAAIRRKSRIGRVEQELRKLEIRGLATLDERTDLAQMLLEADAQRLAEADRAARAVGGWLAGLARVVGSVALGAAK